MKKKIMLIEGDQDSAMLMKHVLTKAGYDVIHHVDGDFVLCSYETPHLYIIDNWLPGIDGVALTKHLKIQDGNHNIPILIVSGNLAIQGRTRKVGASAFVAKPFDSTYLLEVVHNLLESHSYLEEENSGNTLMNH